MGIEPIYEVLETSVLPIELLFKFITRRKFASTHLIMWKFINTVKQKKHLGRTIEKPRKKARNFRSKSGA